MEKQKFIFINEGNGIEGIMPVGVALDKITSSKPKVAVAVKQTELIWDPIFECFIPKEDNKDYTLEKGTVKQK